MSITSITIMAHISKPALVKEEDVIDINKSMIRHAVLKSETDLYDEEFCKSEEGIQYLISAMNHSRLSRFLSENEIVMNELEYGMLLIIDKAINLLDSNISKSKKITFNIPTIYFGMISISLLCQIMIFYSKASRTSFSVVEKK